MGFARGDRGRHGPRAGDGPAPPAVEAPGSPARRRDGPADHEGAVLPERRPASRGRCAGALRGAWAGDDRPRGLSALPRLRAPANPLRHDRAARRGAGIEGPPGGQGRRPGRRPGRQADRGGGRRAEDFGQYPLGLGPLGEVRRGRPVRLRRQAPGPDRSALRPSCPGLSGPGARGRRGARPVERDRVRLHPPVRPDQGQGPVGEEGRRGGGRPSRRVGHGRRSRGQADGVGDGALGTPDEQRRRVRDEDGRRGQVPPGGRVGCRERPLGDGQGPGSGIPPRRSRGRPAGQGRAEGRRDDPGSRDRRRGPPDRGRDRGPAGQQPQAELGRLRLPGCAQGDDRSRRPVHPGWDAPRACGMRRRGRADWSCRPPAGGIARGTSRRTS